MLRFIVPAVLILTSPAFAAHHSKWFFDGHGGYSPTGFFHCQHRYCNPDGSQWVAPKGYDPTVWHPYQPYLRHDPIPRP